MEDSVSFAPNGHHERVIRKKESSEKTKVSNKESVETQLPQLTHDLLNVKKDLKELTDRTMMIQDNNNNNVSLLHQQINQLSKW